MQLAAAIEAVPVIAILRASSARRFGAVVDALQAAGITAVELTLTTPGALAALREIKGRSPALALGVGTVTKAAEVGKAVDAGAEYVITPATIVEVIEEGARVGVPVIPGAYTATEIFTAWQAGATAVKLFPAHVGGADYLRSLRGPFPDLPLVPTGGVSLAEAPGYLAAGAYAVGMGGPLIGDACDSDDTQALSKRARDLVEAVAGRKAAASAAPPAGRDVAR